MIFVIYAEFHTLLENELIMTGKTSLQ